MGNKQSAASRGSSAPSSPARVMGGGQPIPYAPNGGGSVGAARSAVSSVTMTTGSSGVGSGNTGGNMGTTGGGGGSSSNGSGLGNSDHSGGGGGGGGGGASAQPAPARTACLDDFVMLKTVGRGSFGKVMMVRKKDDGRVYAMKALKKEQVLKRRQYEHTVAERRILENLDHPFIVSLRFAFQTEHK